MDPLSLPAHLALEQRHQDTLGEQQPCAEIVDRDPDPDRPLPGQAGDRHQPAHALGDLVDARALRVRPALAKAGNAAIDDAWIDLFDRFIIDAEPVFHLRAEILDDDVGLLRQPEKDRLALLALQVERQAPLVAMQVLEIEALAPRAGNIAPRFARRLDLDDIGAPIGELAHRGRPGASMTQIENGKTGERQRSDAHDLDSFLTLYYAGQLSSFGHHRVKNGALLAPE